MPTSTSQLSLKLRQLAEREQRVFATYPLVARYFPAAAVEDARQRIGRSIDRGDGPAMVIGAPGTGKSLLLQVLATHYHARFDVVLLACARLCTRRALLQAILFELGLPYKLRDEGDLRLSLLDHLLSEQCPAGLLLLVDEAQALPTALLDELRILTNLVRGGVPRVRLVLAGCSSLEEAFANPELESFSQRLAARCYLAPLNREETWQYIRSQLAACGCVPEDVFGGEAASAVFEATDGVPRLVNQVCDRALQVAVSKTRARIDRQEIQEAWADLQQLPTPWETPKVSEVDTRESVVEFGRLGAEFNSETRVDLHSDADDTELDYEPTAPAAASVVRSFDAASMEAAADVDPFAEEFEEEEVVLDGYAAWDEMFRSDLPRVENRRDPGFASLVQSAISPAAVPTRGAASSDRHASPAAIRPRLRLADTPETVVGESLTEIAASTASVDERERALGKIISAFSTKESPLVVAAEESILVIEDDAPSSPQAPVRREEYRHLFSRLRSG